MNDFKDMEHNLYLALADVKRLETQVKELDMKTGIDTVYQENRALEAEIERLREREARLLTHEAVDAFWRVWNEIGEPHIHGVYESTWAAFRAALEGGGEDE